jgi:hypothetical protein
MTEKRKLFKDYKIDLKTMREAWAKVDLFDSGAYLADS